MRALLVLVLACGSSSTPPPRVEPKGSATSSATTLTPGVEVPEVGLFGYGVADDAKPTFAATLNGITFEGKPLARLQDGQIAGEELEGGALGFEITRLAEVAGRLDKTKRVLLSFDRRIPYRTLLAVAYTLRKSGLAEVGLLARSGAHAVMAPIALEPRPAAPLVVAIGKTELKLKSDGQPKLTVKLAEKAALADLGSALFELATTQRDRRIVVTADPAIPLQAIAEVIGAVRATPDGKELFPDVSFGESFE